MPIALIAAISSNNCIGKNGTLPWHLPEDMKHFKQVTTGHTVLMGRKTWESIPEKYRPLPKRKNIIITRQIEYPAPQDVLVYNTLDEAIEKHKNEHLFIIGGGQIYNNTIHQADTLYITHVNQHIDGDAFFPKINQDKWQKTEEKKSENLTFITYKKNGS